MLWTCGYEQATLQAEVEPPVEASAGDEVVAEMSSPVESEPSEEVAVEPTFPPPEYGVRLRREPVEGQLGQPLGIEGSPAVMHRFHEALRRAERGEGRANIVIYGASHVASDSFTGYVRGQLQERFGDAGHGFVLPVQPWRSYRHRGVTIESDRERWEQQRVRDRHTHGGAYGLAGVAIDTDQEGAWGRLLTERRRAYGRSVSRFEVYYWKQPSGGSFDVMVDGRRVERVSTEADEAATGYGVYEVEDGPHQLEIRAVGDGVIRIFGVSMDRDVPGVRLDTLGINGSRARFHLLWDEAVYREHLARRDADLIVLAYGTNEAGDTLSMEAYANQLRRVIGRVQEVAPQASCLLVGPTDRPLNEQPRGRRPRYVDRPRTMQINAVQRSVSEEMGCGYFDLVAFMGGPMSMVDWAAATPPHGARDHIHLTRHGYQRLAEEFLAALVEHYSSDGSIPPSAEAAPPAEPESAGDESAPVSASDESSDAR